MADSGKMNQDGVGEHTSMPRSVWDIEPSTYVVWSAYL